MTIVSNPGANAQASFKNSLALNNAYGLYSIAATLASGPLDDLGSPTLFGYSSGSTTRLLLTSASGGTTINGLDASDVTDGFTVLIVNQSTTDSITFTHLASTSMSFNRFSNVSAASVAILPLGAAWCTYVVNKWQFA